MDKMLVPVEQALIPFYGNEILAVRLPDSRIAASLNSLCKMLKLARNGQMERIRRDEDLTEYLLLVLVQTSGGPQRMDVLIAEAIPTWVQGIQEKLVAPEKRSLIHHLKIEIIVVLYHYFLGIRPAQPSSEPEAPPSFQSSRDRWDNASDSPRERLFEALNELQEAQYTSQRVFMKALKALYDVLREDQTKDAQLVELRRVQAEQVVEIAEMKEWLRSVDRKLAADRGNLAKADGLLPLKIYMQALFRLLEQITGHSQMELEREMAKDFRVSTINAIPGELLEDMVEWVIWRAHQPDDRERSEPQ